MATIAPIIDPRTEEQNARYWQSFMRGRTGERLAKEAGIPIVRGASPPIISPEPTPPTGPNQWTRQAVAAPGTEELTINPDALNQLPVAQAQSAINAAMQYQAQRGYMRDIESGTSPDRALSKWAPLMFRSGAGLSSIMKNVAAGNVSPDAGDWVSKEIIPGMFAVRSPGAKTTTIVRKPTEELTKKEQLEMKLKLIEAASKLNMMDPESPEYAATTNMLAQARGELEPSGVRTIVPPPMTPTNPPPARTFKFSPPGAPGLGIPSGGGTPITRDQVEFFLKKAKAEGKTKEDAMKMAREAGFTF